jgi:hypothetical protein
MIYARARNMKMQTIVMPARTAGIQFLKDALPETAMSA